MLREISTARGRALVLIALGGVLALMPDFLFGADASPLDVSVDFHPGGSQKDNAAWLGYILARAHYVDEHQKLYPKAPGPITPTFAEELSARTDAVKFYRELRAKDSTFDVLYFDDLVRVDDNGFLSEYVWTLLHEATWTVPPPNLELAAFESWRKAHLPEHRALTKGSLRFVPHRGS